MKTEEGTYVMCIFTGKICYTEREAGSVINGCKKHIYVGNGRFRKNSLSKAIPRRKYLCKDCGYYHLTSQALFTSDDRNGAWENSFYREYERKQKNARA